MQDVLAARNYPQARSCWCASLARVCPLTGYGGPMAVEKALRSGLELIIIRSQIIAECPETAAQFACDLSDPPCAEQKNNDHQQESQLWNTKTKHCMLLDARLIARLLRFHQRVD